VLFAKIGMNMNDTVALLLFRLFAFYLDRSISNPVRNCGMPFNQVARVFCAKSFLKGNNELKFMLIILII
jgi:hypothetical protein